MRSFTFEFNWIALNGWAMRDSDKYLEINKVSSWIIVFYSFEINKYLLDPKQKIMNICLFAFIIKRFFIY